MTALKIWQITDGNTPSFSFTNSSMKGGAYDGTYYYTAQHSTVDNKVHFYRSSNLLTCTEIGTAFTPSAGWILVSDSIPCVHQGNNVYFGFVYKKDTGGTYLDADTGTYLTLYQYYYQITKYVISTATSSNVQVYSSSWTITPVGFDIFATSNDCGMIIHHARPTPSLYKGYGMVYCVSFGGTIGSSTTAYILYCDYCTSGYWDGSYYWIVASQAPNNGQTTDNLRIFKIGTGATTWTTVQTITTDIGLDNLSQYNINASIFANISGHQILCTKKQLSWRNSTLQNWTINAKDYSYFAPVYTSANTLQWMIVSDGTDVQGMYIFPQGGMGLLSLGVNDGHFLFGANNLVMDTNYNQYELGLVSITEEAYLAYDLDILDFKLFARLYNYELADEEYIMFYDSTNVLQFFGWANMGVAVARQRQTDYIELISPLEQDLNEPYTATHSSTAPETIVSTILSTCGFCTAGTLSASGITVSVTYDDRPKKDCLRDMLKMMGRIPEISTALAISMKSTPTDSTITLAYTDIGEIQVQNIKTKATRVILYYGTTLTKYEKRSSGLNEVVFIDYYPFVSSATDIERIANNLLSANTYHYNVVINVVDKGNFVAGQTVTFSYNIAPHYIVADTFFIVGVRYNPVTKDTSLRLSDVIIHQTQSPTAQIQAQVDTKVDSTTVASGYVALTGNQTVAGVKTFSNPIWTSYTGQAMILAAAESGKHVYLAFYPDGLAGSRGAYMGYTTNGATTLAIVNEKTNGIVQLAPNGTGTVYCSDKRVSNVSDPSNAQDAATKNYVDSVDSSYGTPPPYGSVTLNSGWSNYHSDHSYAGYLRTHDGTVHIKGTLTRNSSSIYVPFTLAAGCRPAKTLMFWVNGDGGVSRMDVLSDGRLYYQGSAMTYINIEITFHAEQ